jgi:hypothetical protein
LVMENKDFLSLKCCTRKCSVKINIMFMKHLEAKTTD